MPLRKREPSSQASDSNKHLPTKHGWLAGREWGQAIGTEGAGQSEATSFFKRISLRLLPAARTELLL